MRFIVAILSLSLICACKSDPPSNSSLENNEYTDSTIADISAQLDKNSNDDKLYFERGNAYYNLENYDGAIVDLIQAINLDSLNHTYYHLLTDVLLDYYRSKEAVLTMERCVKLLPDNRMSQLKLAEVYLILKQYEDSMEVCNQLLRKDIQDSEAHFMLGMNFRAQGENNFAINSFQTATELDPELVDAWLILGELYEQQKDPIAIEYYNSAVNIDPNNIAAQHSKAFYLQNNGNVQEAIDIYRNIVILDKNYIGAYLNCGILYLTQDSTELALEQFDIMAKTKPDNAIAYFYRGQAYQDLGNIEAAKENYKTAVTLDPEYVKAKKALSAL